MSHLIKIYTVCKFSYFLQLIGLEIIKPFWSKSLDIHFRPLMPTGKETIGFTDPPGWVLVTGFVSVDHSQLCPTREHPYCNQIWS